MRNNASLPLAATPAAWQLPSRRKAAVAWLIITESAMFTIFVIAYLFYLGKSLTGPSPAQVLEMPIIAWGRSSSPLCTRAKNCDTPSAYASSQALSSEPGSSAS